MTIAIKDVSYSVPTRQRPILDHLTVTFNNNERVAIIGEIGSGKTTFLKMLLNLNQPTGGSININNISITNIPKSTLRKVIGYVPQNPILFNRPIIENIRYGIKHPVTDNAIQSLIDSLNLTDMFQDENGLSTLHKSAGKGGSNLSGGQRQIVASLRALLQNPKVLILDEVTSSIDAHTKEKLFKIFDRLFEDKTVIIVTHDKDMLRLASKVYRMKEGRLTPDTSTQSFNSNPFGTF